MAPKNGRTYGKKKNIGVKPSAIFAASSPLSRLEKDSCSLEQERSEEPEEPDLEKAHTRDKQASVTKDLVDAFSVLEINPSSHIDSPAPVGSQPSPDSGIQSLLSLAKTDALPISIESWSSVLPEHCTLVKIAEASYAEVYRITTATATSIVKIMPLKTPTDTDSQSRVYASEISDVIPELQIMNVLTEIPGFVQFKGARIVTGKQSEKFVHAWEDWAGCEGDEELDWNSEFEHPRNYGNVATFLAIELGDAGDVLEEVVIDTIDKFWDVFLGIVIALARAEVMHEYEHRDLHENNICIYSHPSIVTPDNTMEDVLYGRSNLEVTLIDYGLSRAILRDDTVTFKDLETDLEIFRGKKWHRQFEVYRQMRSHLFSGTVELLPLNWHKKDASAQWMTEAGKSWRDHTPLSNVFWISYLFSFLSAQYSKHGPGRKADNKREIDLTALDLEARLDFLQTRRVGEEEDERFFSAGECLGYCVQRGWIDERQLTGTKSSADEMDFEEFLESGLESLTISQRNAHQTDSIASPEERREISSSVTRSGKGSRTNPAKVSQSSKHSSKPSSVQPLTPSTHNRSLRPRQTPSSPSKTPSKPDVYSLLTSPLKVPQKLSIESARTKANQAKLNEQLMQTRTIVVEVDQERCGRNHRSRERAEDDVEVQKLSITAKKDQPRQMDDRRTPSTRRKKATNKQKASQ